MYFWVIVILKANVRVKSNSYIEDTYINSFSEVGLAYRIRKNTQLGKNVKLVTLLKLKILKLVIIPK